MPPKTEPQNGTGWKLFAALTPLVIALSGLIAAGLIGRIERLENTVSAHSTAEGHPGTLAELRSFRREFDDFRSEIRAAIKKP